VTDVAELLFLLHGARGRVSTVRATVRMWRHLRRRGEAFQRAGWSASGPSGASEVFEEIVRLWLAPPDRAREEREGPGGPCFSVRRGSDWWRYDDVNGAMSNEGAPDSHSGIGDELDWLLDPAPVIGFLEFDKIVRAQRAGRPVMRVRAVPRTTSARDDAPLMRLGAVGADELLLEVDAERGALLRIESRFEREPIALSEVVEIAFDEVFDEETFVFTPPAGEAIRSIADLVPVRHDLTIEQAVARAPFTVWIAERVPAGWAAQIGFAAEQDRPPLAPEVHLHYRAPDGMRGFSIAESPANHPGEHDEYEHAAANPWRSIDRDQRRMQVREPAESWQPAQVRLELDGTRILINSTDLDADALLDVAGGLVRAPAEPPELGA
jgi:outer membrane lipoprotein-sorting protein